MTLERTPTTTLMESLTSNDTWAAAHAAEELGRRRAAEAVPALIHALHAEEQWAWYKRQDPETQLALGGTGEGEDPILTLQNNAALALAHIGAEQAVPELVRLLQTTDDLDLRATAAQALTYFDTEAARAILAQHLEKLAGQAQSDEPTVRYYVVKELGVIGLASSVPTLLNALQDRSFLVRETAVDALGVIGARQTDTPLREQVVGALIELLADTYTLHKSLPRVCDHAAAALLNIDTEVARVTVEQWKRRDALRGLHA